MESSFDSKDSLQDHIWIVVDMIYLGRDQALIDEYVSHMKADSADYMKIIDSIIRQRSRLSAMCYDRADYHAYSSALDDVNCLTAVKELIG